MSSQNLKDRTKKYAISILRYLEKLPNKYPYSAINNQLSRCSMSVGANYRAASRAKSPRKHQNTKTQKHENTKTQKHPNTKTQTNFYSHGSLL